MLQTRTVESGTLDLLKELMAMPLLGQFHLGGGTALALQIGHRFSVDLDLYTTYPFENSTILDTLDKKYSVSILLDESGMFMLTINDIKVDFVKMGYPILFPTIETQGVRMLNISDIAAMKLKAVTQRGSKKDFYDIYYLLKHISLESILSIFKEKFKQHEIFHVVKSLTYFEDAESNPDPIVFDKSLKWQEVKRELRNAVNGL